MYSKKKLFSTLFFNFIGFSANAQFVLESQKFVDKSSSMPLFFSTQSLLKVQKFVGHNPSAQSLLQTHPVLKTQKLADQSLQTFKTAVAGFYQNLQTLNQIKKRTIQITIRQTDMKVKINSKVKTDSQNILNESLKSSSSNQEFETREQERKDTQTNPPPFHIEKEVPASSDKNFDSKKQVLSGTKKKLIKSHLKRFSSPFPNEKEIDFIMSQYLLEKSKKEEELCPSNYKLKNNYSLYGEIDFKSVRKNSCQGESAKEVYHLSKSWKIERVDKKNFVLAYHKILKWMLDLFFYPFLFAEIKTPPKEFKDHKLGEACPACSFRFEYDYRYNKKGFIDFDVKAICSDKKIPFSKVKQDAYIKNDWICVKKP